MTSEKFIMISLDDERSKKISEILGNATCKKIIENLAEKESSEKDIADSLKIPINTVEYNLKKLIESGLVEKTKNFFWSVKGRKIDMYKLANKKIIISPRSFLKGIVPSLIALFLGSFGIKLFFDKTSNISYESVEFLKDSSASSVAITGEKATGLVQNFVPPVQKFNNICSSNEPWAWFLLGGLFVILIFLLWNQYKKMKGGF